MLALSRDEREQANTFVGYVHDATWYMQCPLTNQRGFGFALKNLLADISVDMQKMRLGPQ